MTLGRRDLLALGALLPGFASLAGRRRPWPDPPSLPHRPDAADESAWEQVARAFVIEGTHLNTGTYGACPLPVLEATIHHLRAFERITRQEHPDAAALHRRLEEFLGAWPGSVAIVRNTTEAMNIVAAGLDLSRGDEIVTTTHEHIGGRCCWEMHAARHGTVLRLFDPPLDPVDEEAIVTAWLAATTARTRVWSISHVLFTTGLRQPVERLVREARRRGIVAVVDGAHPPGMLPLDLTAIDADYYATSPHKWLLAPKGTGVLVTHPDRQQETWPLVASGDWRATDHRRFEHVGTANESLVAGLVAALEFQHTIGSDAIVERLRHLAALLHDQLVAVPGLRMVSPSRAEFRTPLIAFTKAGTTAERLQATLGAARIRTRRIAEMGYEYLRLSAHVHVLPRELERAVAIIRAA